MSLHAQSHSRLLLYAALSAIETDLRIFILQHTPSEDPHDLLGSPLHAKCLDRAAQHAATLSSATVDDLLPYLDFADHFHLINTHRDLFPPSAASHIRDVTPKLDALVPIRNRVMHSRPLHGADITTTIDLVERLAQVDVGPWTAVRDTLAQFQSDPTSIYDLRIPVLTDSSSHIAHNLPTPDFDDTGFIGRADFLQHTIDALLGPYPVITILGAGGVGKSAVALKAAYDLLDHPDCPFELIVWSSSKTHTLSGPRIQRIRDSITSSLDLITEVAEGLGGTATGDPVDALLEDIQALPTLLILDNLETVLDDRIRSLLGRLPRGTTVLVTSRVGVGAYEHPLTLESMHRTETVDLMRSLARVHQVPRLVRCNNRKLEHYTRRLFNNPGFIKWFVAGVQVGTRPEDLLAHPGEFLEFCLSNVYNYLSTDARRALLCLVYLSEASQADIGYHSNLDGLKLTEAINGLLRTNMVSTHYVAEGSTYDTYYRVTDLATKYLETYHPISAEELSRIEERRKKLVAVREQLKAVERRDPYQRTAIVLRSHRDIVPAKYLRDALTLSRRAEYDDARVAVDKAVELAPEYFEAHRVKGIVAGEAGKTLEAESAFVQALELRPGHAPLLYGYGRFLMEHRDDAERAAQHMTRALDVDPDRVLLMLELGRARLYLGEFRKARKILGPLQEKRDELSRGEAQKAVDLFLQTFLREGELAIDTKDFGAGLRALEAAKEFWDTIPMALIDRRVRRRLDWTTVSATRMIEGMSKARHDDVDRARRIREWLGMTGPGLSGREVDREGPDVRFGKVVNLPVAGKYGFLESDDGSREFFHRQEFRDPTAWEALSVGAGVSFRVALDDDGRSRAVDLIVEHPGHVVRDREGVELEGRVMSLLRTRGFGFVRAFDGPNYFFHRSFAEDWSELSEGCRVRFVVGINPRDGAVCARAVRSS